MIDSLWKQERQGQNAREIAERAGWLYDKFVLFIQDLDELGSRLQQVDKAYAAARNKLCEGRGNLVSRSEQLKLLGAVPARACRQTCWNGRCPTRCRMQRLLNQAQMAVEHGAQSRRLDRLGQVVQARCMHHGDGFLAAVGTDHHPWHRFTQARA